MLTILDIRTNTAKVFSRQSEESRNANLGIINYLDHMAKTCNININAWDIEAVFSDPANKKQSLDLIKDRGAINKLFFMEVEKFKATPNADSDRVAVLLRTNLEKIGSVRREARMKTLNNEVANKIIEIDSTIKRTMEYIAAVAKHKKEMAELNGANTEEKVISDIQELLKGNFYEFVEIRGTTIIFATKNDIINKFNKPSAKIDLTVNLGKFQVLFDINSLAMVVKPHKDNVMVENHYHPHVSNNGGICWGDAANHAKDLLLKFDVKGALLLLASLLTTYNEQAPYVALGTFDVKRKEMDGAKTPTPTQEVLPF